MGYNPGQRAAIATLLHHRTGGQEFVFCFDDGEANPQVYWSPYVRAAAVPRSRAVDVLQAAHQGRSSARAGLRFYVYSHTAHGGLTRMCQGMLDFLGVVPQAATILTDAGPSNFPLWTARYPTQLVGPRVAGLDDFLAHALGPRPGVDVGREGPGDHTVHRVYMMVAFALAAFRTAALGAYHGTGHNIATVLVGPDGTILGWGLNTKTQNYTFHAEVNALQSYYRAAGSPVPNGSRLYTTLKPCKMCAGMIRSSTATDGAIKVFYGQNDPGDHARNTALDHPAGMVAELGAGTVKPLRTYSTPSYDTAAIASLNLATTLTADRGRAIGRGIYPLTTFLGTASALGRFGEARVALQRKLDKYGVDYYGNDNVRRVLRHVAPLLTSLGLPEWQGVVIPDESLA